MTRRIVAKALQFFNRVIREAQFACFSTTCQILCSRADTGSFSGFSNQQLRAAEGVHLELPSPLFVSSRVTLFATMPRTQNLRPLHPGGPGLKHMCFRQSAATLQPIETVTR